MMYDIILAEVNQNVRKSFCRSDDCDYCHFLSRGFRPLETPNKETADGQIHPPDGIGQKDTPMRRPKTKPVCRNKRSTGCFIF